MTKVYLVRHGQTAWNLEEVFRGRMDIPLDDTGPSTPFTAAPSPALWKRLKI